jgi:hypothetical protein
MEKQRPKLTDPEEFAIIKSIHFEKDILEDKDLDQLERLERQESKHRNLNKSSR